MTPEQKQDLSHTLKSLNEQVYLKQRDDEIADALRAKFGKKSYKVS